MLAQSRIATKHGKVGMPMPFDSHNCHLDTPFEFLQKTAITHLNLVNGDKFASDDNSKYVQAIHGKLGKTPYHIKLNANISQFHKILLSLAPPIVPPNPDDFKWQLNDLADWVIGSDQYKSWNNQPAMGVLHIKGSPNMRLVSEKLYTQFLDERISRNVCFFAFRKNDDRFNTAGAMLASLICQLVSRFRTFGGAGEALTMLVAQRSWCERDLVQLFESFFDDIFIPFTVFMIACLDECNETNDQFLQLLKEIGAASEKKFRFIFTTTNDTDKSLEDVVSSWFTIDIQDFEKTGTGMRGSTMESIYSIELNRLTQKKPTYHYFLGDIKDILTKCGDNHQLGHLMVDWLANYGPSGSQSGIRKALESLSSATPQAIAEAIFVSFGSREKRARDMFSWIRYTFEPPTVQELAIAMELEDGVSDEGIDDIDVDEIRGDTMKFGRVFSFSEYEVDFSYAMYPHEEAKAEEQAAAHAWIASLCLRYLSFPSVRERAKEMCERYASATPISRPKQDLTSYAVNYWPKHYKCAGTKKPVTAAKAFFHDTETREMWAQARYVLSNPVTRLERHHLSPLPFIAMAGLDDLLTAQIEDEKGMAAFSINAGLALIEAASNGDAHMVRLLAEASSPNKETLAEALVIATAVGSEDILNYLISEAAKLESFDWPPILFPRVAWLGLARTARLLFEAGAKTPQSDGLFEKSLLHIAAETRNSGVTKELLNVAPDVDAVLVDFNATALHYAAVRGDMDTIQMLIDAGANVNYSYISRTPASQAAKHGNHLALGVLLKAGAEINTGAAESDYYDVQFMDTAKPIVYAAILGRTKCVQLLIRHGADFTATLDDKPALWYAASRGHVEICQMLLKAGADPDQLPNGFQSILEAAINSTVDSAELLQLVELLIPSNIEADNITKMSQRQSSALCIAAKLGSQQLVKHLLNQGINPDSSEDDTSSPLYLASFHGHVDVVDLLIQRGSSAVNKPAEKNWTPLHAAYDNPRIVKILLSHGANIDAVSESGTIVHLAAKYKKTEILSMILQHRPRPDLETLTSYEAHEDVTALCIACILGHADIIRLLLQNGSNINHKTLDGAFPLMLSIESATEDNISAMHTLLEFRPDLDQVDGNGSTALHQIKESTPLALVRDLYTAGFNAGVVNNRGDSVLSLAVAKNREAARFLISKRLDISIPNIGTVLDMLATKGDWELFKAAIDAGADTNPARSGGSGHTLLCSALSGFWEENGERIIRYLLVECGISPNEKCEDGGCSYAILKSASIGPGAIRLLLEHGADIEAQDAMGRRPMHIAAFEDISSVEVLLEHGAELLPRTVVLMTPLHFLVASGLPLSDFMAIWDKFRDNHGVPAGDIETEGERLDDEEETNEEENDIQLSTCEKKKSWPRLSIDDKDIDDWTPLMWAAKRTYNDIDNILELCERGADLWMRGKVLDARRGDVMWSPLKISRYYGAKGNVYEALTPSEKIRKLPDGREERWDDKEHRSMEA
ncbi:hypothetical protein ACHAPE_006563, partial [Trichoderma viride]